IRGLKKEISPLLNEYGLVITELSEDDGTSSALSVACQCDAVLLAVEAEKTRSETIERLKRDLESAGANLIGCVVYGERRYLPVWLQKLI
ncbi:MAG: hypothetical protein KDA99_20035, partial [Planctomycetales bacterium]|nr:hypothetical protein [Planctomycetales bacterium]